MSDLYNDAVTVACEAMGITWQDAADTIDPFLKFVDDEMWNYGWGESEEIISVLREKEEDDGTSEVGV